MTYASAHWSKGIVALWALLPVLSAVGANPNSATTRADLRGTAGEICVPKGRYPTGGGGETLFANDRCFSQPVTNPYPWEKKSSRARKADPFNGARIVQYDYHDALYHCAKRDMRLPTIAELSALFAYANRGNGATNGPAYAIVASSNDSRYPGGLHGWGGGSKYWSHTFAGNGRHRVIDMGTGRVSIDHDVNRRYVSCVH